MGVEIDPGEPFQGRHPDDHPEPELVAMPGHDDERVHVAMPGKGAQWLEIDAALSLDPKEYR